MHVMIETNARDANKMLVESPIQEVLQSERETKQQDIVFYEKCDLENIGNPQFCTDYAFAIFEFLRASEKKFLIDPTMIYKQLDINEKMRAILVDWLVDVHLKFKLLPDTLFLTVNIIDRYLEAVQVSRQELQLIGVTAMFIAAKYEEIYSPETKDYAFITDNAYTVAQILETEGKILTTLKFELTYSSQYRFLIRYARIKGIEEKLFMLARYVIELALIEHRMQKYSPSQIAASAIYLACKIFRKEAWNDEYESSLKYDELTVKSGAKDLCHLLQTADRSALQAVRKKFSHPKYLEISKIQLERCS